MTCIAFLCIFGLSKLNYMKTILFIVIAALSVLQLNSQTVIEMTHPGDANLILLEVPSIDQADFVVYRTEDKNEYTEWDLMWRFKKWGFSNFSVYLSKNPQDTLLNDVDMGVQYAFHGKIYFTSNKDERGYKNPNFRLEGVFRKTNSDNSEKAKQSKQQATKKSLDEDGD